MTVRIDSDLSKYVREYADANGITIRSAVNALLEKGIFADQKDSGVYQAPLAPADLSV